MKLKVEVTAEDIKEGGHSSCYCPIHRAMVRALSVKPGMLAVYAWGVSVSNRFIYFPSDVTLWLHEYDYLWWRSDYNPTPITFALEVP